MFRRRAGVLQVFLVHMGGPFWVNKDLGAWSIPKGEFSSGEDPLSAARREFREETGFEASGDFFPLTPVKQAGGKVIQAWAFEGDLDPAASKSNTFAMEWPPRSGRMQEFPEVDRTAWFSLEEAEGKILKGQAGFLGELQEILLRHPPEG